MALKDINEVGQIYDVMELPHLRDFERLYLRIPEDRRIAIEEAINQQLDELLLSTTPITNTSLEGGARNPITGKPGDWSGTVFEPIFHACGQSEEQAALLFGNIWKKIIIERRELWIGVRPDPTFPNRGITLMGKSYFPAR